MQGGHAPLEERPMGEPTGSLRKECLNFTGLTAMAIALISPTMTAALIVPLMYSSAGNASWMAYAFGTVMLLFVALNLNQFARRSSAAGSMYGYTVMGLGPTAGNISGWCLIWAYLFIGTAGMTGFTIFASTLLEMMGIHLPHLALFAVCAGSIWYLGYKDIRLSSGLMLVLEGLSVALILMLCMIVLFGGKSPIDTAQIKLEGASFSGLALGVVTAIFSLVGFECDRFRRGSRRTSAHHSAGRDREPADDRSVFRPGLVYRGPGLRRLQDHAGQDRCAAERAVRHDAGGMAQGADLVWRDGELLFARAVLHEFGRPHPLPDGQARRPAPRDRNRARDQRNPARRGDPDVGPDFSVARNSHRGLQA